MSIGYAPAPVVPIGQNLLVNPGVEFWQRGVGPYTLHGVYGADGWSQGVFAPTTLSVTRDTVNADAGSLYCAACTVAAFGAAVNYRQKLEELAQLKTRQITFAVRVKATAANTVRPWISLDNGATLGYGAYHTGGGVYQTLTYTTTVPAGSTGVYVGVEFVANGTYYVDNAVLAIGATAAPYEPRHPADDLGRCKRYYFELGGGFSERICMLQAFGVANARGVLQLPVEMAIAPTVTSTTPASWAVHNATSSAVACTGLSAEWTTQRSAGISAVVASGLVAGNAAQLVANSDVNARIRFEANP